MITALVPKISQPALVPDHALGFVELMHLVEDAKNKRLISSFYAINTDLQQEIAINNKDVTYKWRFNTQGVKEAIDFINSLYTETFVISNPDKLLEIDVFKCPKFELENGVKGTIQASVNNKEFSVQFEDKSWGNVGFMVLKGATVTQKRGAV